MNLKKGILFTAIALLPVLACCLDLVFLIIEMSIYNGGDSPQGLNLWQSVFHLGLICFVWGISVVGILLLAKHFGFNMMSATEKPNKKQMFFLLLIILAGIAFMSSTWEFRFKPLVELSNFISRYGNAGVWAFVFQYLYYLFESALILLLVALGQHGAEAFFSHPFLRYIPFGGAFCALTWGMLHGLSKDLLTAVLCIVLSALFGVSYLLARRNLRYAYAVVALIFLL